MIIYHQNNVAAFAGNYTWYWQFQPIIYSRISVTSAAAAFEAVWAHRANILL